MQLRAVGFADELSSKLLTQTQRDSGWAIEFDLAALLIAPSEIPDRMSKLVNGGVLTVNEAREQLGLADVLDGDELRVPVNTAPWDRWVDGDTGAQQLAHPDTPANPQEASAPRLVRIGAPRSCVSPRAGAPISFSVAR